MHAVLVGTAGWSLPSAAADSFPANGTHLERYAQVFGCVEINSSFYRPHRPATYARWRDSTPTGFRFSVKVPKTITHESRLRDAEALLKRFIDESAQLQDKLGCLLVQLPPRLAWDASVAQRFFIGLKTMTTTPAVCEARHLSWFTKEAGEQLAELGVSQVIADPEVAALPFAAAQSPLTYLRLHGSPRMYYSAYSKEALDTYARRIRMQAREGRQVWCVFDNTAEGAAVPNALALQRRLEGMR